MNEETAAMKKEITFPKEIGGQPVKFWSLKKADSGAVKIGMLLSRKQINALKGMKPEERLKLGVGAEVFGAGPTLPSAPVIKGVQGIWGIEAAYSGVLGAASVMRVRSKSNSEKDYLFDDQGFKSAVVFFDSSEECNIELVMMSGTTEAAPGDELSLDSLTFLVMDGERNWDQKGWKKLSVNATYFPNVDLGTP